MKSTRTPKEALAMVAYPGQPEQRRMYQSGYEHYMDQMPSLNPNDKNLDSKVAKTKSLMQSMSDDLRNQDWLQDKNPGEKEFNRTILAMENPLVKNGTVVKERTEIVLARWGNGFTSPVHGHAIGYMHEEILFGKMRVNQFRLVRDNIVRLTRTDIITKGLFASQYTKPNSSHKFKRQTLIHSFTSIGFSGSVHYLPEHTRDGRDNTFEVEYFEDVIPMNVDDVKQITVQESMYLRKGDVVMVRSENVPEYGDHFIVITGHPVVKPHGLRIQDIAIAASPNGISLLDLFENKMGVTALKLNDDMTKKFREFHSIEILDGEVIFPKP